MPRCGAFSASGCVRRRRQRAVVRVRVQLELTYKTPTGKVANELLYRHDEPRLDLVEQGRPWSFDGDGRCFVSFRRRTAFDWRIYSIRCLPSTRRSSTRCRIRSRRCTSRCCRASRCASCCRRSGRRQDHHGRPTHQGAAHPWRPAALPDVCPGSLVEQWQDELCA